MATEFNWKEFFRIAIGVFFIGMGIGIVISSAGGLYLLLAGFASAAIGVAVLFAKQ